MLTLGWSDFYREVLTHGGIPDTSFFHRMVGRWGSSTQEIEDLETEVKIHPFFDAFWESKRAQLHKITCPAYVIASWQDQGLHTRGTLEGWKKIQSKEKWLECHGRKVRSQPNPTQPNPPFQAHRTVPVGTCTLAPGYLLTVEMGILLYPRASRKTTRLLR